MVYKTCSIKKLFAQIFRDFKPSNSGWIDDAIEWVADATEIMGVVQGYKETNKDLEIVDHRIKLPCEMDSLLGIEYQGMRLQRSGAVNHKNHCCIDNLVIHPEASYSLNPNYIETTFKTGCIKVYYYGIETDCDGLPTIIDHAMYREALEWYVLMKMIGRGFKHQTFDYKHCYDMWERTYPKAQNRARMPDVDGYEKFKKSWTGLAKSTNMTNQFFNNEVAQGNTLGANTPGTLVQTFPILGNNNNNP